MMAFQSVSDTNNTHTHTHTSRNIHSLRNSRITHTTRVNKQGIPTAITGLLDVGAVYLRDIRSDGFTLFFASLPGKEAEGGEVIYGILAGMILFSVFLMMVALAHNGHVRVPH